MYIKGAAGSQFAAGVPLQTPALGNNARSRYFLLLHLEPLVLPNYGLKLQLLLQKS